ncbi:hypothetical protein JYU34_013203, partial [Plutella xylostella]
AGLTLRKDKCEFFKDEITYLGYVINKFGIKKSLDKVKAIQEAQPPTSLKELQSFLGLVNYYRSFVKNASGILSPLYDLLKKGTKWSWTAECQHAFDRIKNILSSDSVLAHFNPKAKLILTVDAGPKGLGAILSQVGPDGVEQPISYASRTLNAAERNYSQIQKEATAIVFGVRRYHQYLYARSEPFVLRTDHKPLLAIFGSHKGVPEVSANRLQRYSLFLSSYNYVIEYVRSAENTADFLSRAPLPETSSRASAGLAGNAGDVTAAAYINFVVEGALPVTSEQLSRETSDDVILRQVIKYVCDGWPRKVQDARLKPYFLCKVELSFEKGVLMRGHKVVIPEKMQQKVLRELHNSHLGIVKTKALARSKFWFPGVDTAIENMINSCHICLSMRPSPPRAPVVSWPYPDKPFQRIHMDFLGPIKNEMYLVIVDAHTKWVECYNMKDNITTSMVISKLCEYMSRFGIPISVVSDNGSSFTSGQFSDFCKLNGISHVTTAVYHPASNGQAESCVKIVKKGIKTALLAGGIARDVNNRLLKYLFDYRNSVHSTTGRTPASLVFGWQPRSRLDLLTVPSPSPPSPLSDKVRNNQFLQNSYHEGVIRKDFDTNDVVLYKLYVNKNKFNWCKGLIVEKVGLMLFKIK